MRAKLRMISEGESDLVLNRIEHSVILRALETAWDAFSNLTDSVGNSERRGRAGQWADSKACIAACRQINIEVATISSIIRQAVTERDANYYPAEFRDPPF